MNQVNVGIGEYVISSNTNEELKTFALGSCVAVIMYDEQRHIAALTHYALPDSSINTNKAESQPGYFVDSGLPLILQEMKKLGCNRRSTWIKLVGGSNIMDESRRFDIGKRNVLAVKKLLWKKQLGTIAEDVGGDRSRTVSIRVDTGELIISNTQRRWTL